MEVTRSRKHERTPSKPSDQHTVPCEHKRVVDYVRLDDGEQTGDIACAECGAVLPAKEPARPMTPTR